MSQQRGGTIALHDGQAPDPTTNARVVPIDQTTSFTFDATVLTPVGCHLPDLGADPNRALAKSRDAVAA